MRITATVDYALRAAVELAAAPAGVFVTAEEISHAQHVPRRFLMNILGDLRAAGIVESRRGNEGGYRLRRPGHETTLADVMRAVEGSLASVRGAAPELVVYEGSALLLREVWIAIRASLRAVAEHVSLADVVKGEIPPATSLLASDPDARRQSGSLLV